MKKLELKNLTVHSARSYKFYLIPREIIDNPAFDSIDYGSKILYALMLGRASISSRNPEFVDKNGDIYIIYKIEQIQEDMRCSNKTAGKMLEQLHKIGLVEKKIRGQGKPAIIYVKDFSSVHFKECTSYTSRSVESTFQEVKELPSSNGKLPYNYINKIDQSKIEGSMRGKDVETSFSPPPDTPLKINKKPRKPNSEKPTFTKEDCFNIIKENHHNFSDDIRTAIIDWVEYKVERTLTDKKETFYTPKGFIMQLSEIANKITQYSEFYVITIINHSIASNWKGIIWEKLADPKFTASLIEKPPEVKKSSFDLDKFFEKAVNRGYKDSNDENEKITDADFGETDSPFNFDGKV